ncbi:MAG: hypothetical protein C5S41_02320 [Candidatus Methanomarinus sp.]|nr:MAG: hypothetical protein C5S41_02320 [ANME-2 cluster archaeon]
MIETGEFRSERCICELCSDISQNWMDMRSKFGYTMLGDIFKQVNRYEERRE